MPKQILVLTLVGLALLAGCDNSTGSTSLPEVNDRNCQLEKINQIEDKAARQDFTGQCSRRSIGIAPTEKPKNWLDLTDKE
ncbi:entry exclusion lipoprotein TrbK [Alcaligenes ammonioxydans]|uniref:entry exclusion lipoprotein TrbK n=1 Tax=Alcaligenes ammonioxydans TaxID=2582914 RepID=UPI001F05301C|nr:entry exclusion lipoprotein TrbK [Alcaligenes ammonioxydans]MCH1879084.1 entry exclusion lipoprotein TrbK [Alcaligenes ammonioxydans]